MLRVNLLAKFIDFTLRLRNCPACGWGGFESEADLRRRANEMNTG